MLIEQIIEFKLREPGLPGCTCTLIIGYFHDKTKVSKENISPPVTRQRQARTMR